MRVTSKISERGQAIILIVFSIIGVMGMAALAVDGGRTYLERRNVQNAADSIALGSAIARVRDPQGAWAEKGYAIGKTNGYDVNDNTRSSVGIYSPPITGVYFGNIEYIQVIVRSRVDTYFGRVVGIEQVNVLAEAISRTKTSELKELLDGNAIVSLRPTSECADIHDVSFWIRGESTLNVQGGGIFVNSNNPDCAFRQSGSGSIIIDGGELKVVGGLDVQKNYLLTPPPIANSSPISYPPPFMMPKFGCREAATIKPDGIGMTPGSWSSSSQTFPPPDIQYFDPGIYCIFDTDFVTSGDMPLQGDDVVFKIEGGMLRLSSEIDVNLTAPTTGDFAGLLFYLPIDNNRPVVVNASEGSRFQGTFLAPASQIRINGNDSSYGFHSQFIGYSIISDGMSLINIVYNDRENYDAYTMPEVQLIK